EGRLVSTGTAPNFDDDVTFVVWIARYQKLAKLGHEPIGPRLKLGNLIFRHRRQGRVLVGLRDKFRVVKLLLDSLKLLKAFDDVVQIRPLLSKLVKALGIGENVG